MPHSWGRALCFFAIVSFFFTDGFADARSAARPGPGPTTALYKSQRGVCEFAPTGLPWYSAGYEPSVRSKVSHLALNISA